MSEPAVVRHRERLPFRPTEAKKKLSITKAAVKYATEMRDWEKLHVAIDEMINIQKQFVAWWKDSVRGAGNPQLFPNGNNWISVEEGKTGISHQQVSRWSNALGRPDGSEAKMIEAELGKRIEEVEHELNAAKQELHAQKNKVLDAATPDLKEAHRPKSDDKPDIQKKDIRLNQYGTSNKYAIAKLRKDRPDIHERVLAGELTANAGMVEAGFRKKRASKRKSALEKILILLPHLDEAEWERLIARINAIRQGQLL